MLTEIEAPLRQWGLDPIVVFRSDDNATLQSLVAAGVGTAFMPCLTLDLRDGRTVFVDVRDHLPPRRVGIAWHRDSYRSAASYAFVEAASNVAARVEVEIAPATFATLRTVDPHKVRVNA